MAITKIETKTEFQASDGRKFDSAEQAEKYDKFITAKKEYQYALARLKHAAMETFMTADGYQFEYGKDYFWVKTYSDIHIEELSWLGRQVRIDVDELDRGRLTFYEKASVHNDWTIHKQRQISISQLYRFRENAEKKMLEEKLAERTRLDEDIAELEKKF